MFELQLCDLRLAAHSGQRSTLPATKDNSTFLSLPFSLCFSLSFPSGSKSNTRSAARRQKREPSHPVALSLALAILPHTTHTHTLWQFGLALIDVTSAVAGSAAALPAPSSFNSLPSWSPCNSCCCGARCCCLCFCFCLLLCLYLFLHWGGFLGVVWAADRGGGGCPGTRLVNSRTSRANRIHVLIH